MENKALESEELEELFDKKETLTLIREQELLKKFILYIESINTKEELLKIFKDENYQKIFGKYIGKLFK